MPYDCSPHSLHVMCINLQRRIFVPYSRDATEHTEEYNKDISVAGYTAEIRIHCYDSFSLKRISATFTLEYDTQPT